MARSPSRRASGAPISRSTRSAVTGSTRRAGPALCRRVPARPVPGLFASSARPASRAPASAPSSGFGTRGGASGRSCWGVRAPRGDGRRAAAARRGGREARGPDRRVPRRSRSRSRHPAGVAPRDGAFLGASASPAVARCDCRVCGGRRARGRRLPSLAAHRIGPGRPEAPSPLARRVVASRGLGPRRGHAAAVPRARTQPRFPLDRRSLAHRPGAVARRTARGLRRFGAGRAVRRREALRKRRRALPRGVPAEPPRLRNDGLRRAFPVRARRVALSRDGEPFWRARSCRAVGGPWRR